MTDGRLRGRRIVDVRRPAPKPHDLPQDGRCDDIDLDHANSRLAMVSEWGHIDAFERPSSWCSPRKA